MSVDTRTNSHAPVRRGVEEELVVITRIFTDGPDLIASVDGLFMAFGGERDLRVGDVRVRDVIDVPFALRMPHKYNAFRQNPEVTWRCTPARTRLSILCAGYVCLLNWSGTYNGSSEAFFKIE